MELNASDLRPLPGAGGSVYPPSGADWVLSANIYRPERFILSFILWSTRMMKLPILSVLGLEMVCVNPPVATAALAAAGVQETIPPAPSEHG